MPDESALETVRAALAFYGDDTNWRTPSRGFAAQYDPQPSPVEAVGSKMASDALAALAALRERVGAMAREVYVPGSWVCDRCGFALVVGTYSAVDGSMAPIGAARDACPNDGAPLRPVTWRERAEFVTTLYDSSAAGIAALRADVAALREALRRHGIHSVQCSTRFGYEAACTCGLDAHLSAAKSARASSPTEGGGNDSVLTIEALRAAVATLPPLKYEAVLVYEPCWPAIRRALRVIESGPPDVPPPSTPNLVPSLVGLPVRFSNNPADFPDGKGWRFVAPTEGGHD